MIITIRYCGQMISACYSEEKNKKIHIKTESVSLPLKLLFCFGLRGCVQKYIIDINQ